jgi:1-acyl-sn-glycerol-3-phosphate acyltransferase
LSRSWRFVATAFLFAAFGVGGLVAGLTVFPVIAISSRDNAVIRRRARAFIGASFRTLLWLMRVLGVARFDMDPAVWRQLCAERGAIIAANHPTLIDVVFLIGYIDQVNCVVKSALWRNPFLRWGVMSAAYIRNDDLESMIGACEQALASGENVIILPEATRTVPGRPLRVQRGAANIAIRANASIRLVHIQCEPPTLSKGERWYRIPPEQPCIAIRLGVSLSARDFQQAGEHFGVAARRQTSVLKAELSKDIFINESFGT